MNAEVKSFLKTQVENLVAAESCYAEAKAAGEAWLAALDTPQEAEQTQKLMAEMQADIMPLDQLIAFAQSADGQKVFGPEMAQELLTHAQDRLNQGEKYCDCPACSAAEAILSQQDKIAD